MLAAVSDKRATAAKTAEGPNDRIRARYGMSAKHIVAACLAEPTSRSLQRTPAL